MPFRFTHSCALFIGMILISVGAPDASAQAAAAQAEAAQDSIRYVTLLDSAIAVLERTPAYSFTMDSWMKGMMDDDTGWTQCEVTLQRLDDDPFGYRFYGVEQYFTVIYNGETALFGTPVAGSMKRIPADKDPGDWIRGTFAGDARFPHSSNKNYFKRLRESSTITRREVREDLCNGVPVFVLCSTHRGDEDIIGAYTEVSLRKSDCFPVAFLQDMDIRDASGTLRQHQRRVVSNLRLNPDIPEGLFDGATLPETVDITPYEENNDPAFEPLKAGEIAPDFHLSTFDGDSVRLSDYRGRVVFLDFWYMRCHPCQQAIPAIKELVTEFAADSVVFLGMNSSDSPTDKYFRNFVDSRDFTYPVVLAAGSAAANHQKGGYRVHGYPHFFIVGRDGVITFSQAGYGEGSKGQFIEEIRKALKPE